MVYTFSTSRVVVAALLLLNLSTVHNSFAGQSAEEDPVVMIDENTFYNLLCMLPDSEMQAYVRKQVLADNKKLRNRYALVTQKELDAMIKKLQQIKVASSEDNTSS